MGTLCKAAQESSRSRTDADVAFCKVTPAIFLQIRGAEGAVETGPVFRYLCDSRTFPVSRTGVNARRSVSELIGCLVLPKA